MRDSMKTAKLIILYLATLFLITACGGSGEPLTREEADTDPVPSTQQPVTLRMSLVDSEDAETTVLADGSPINVNVLVTNESGDPVQGQVIQFLLSLPGLANFSNDTQTSLTNADGVASIQMTVGTVSGSGTVTAGIENAESITAGFQSLGTQQAVPTTLELFSNAVQLASSGGDEIELIAVVKNDQNVLLPGIVVSFAVDQNASLTDIDAQTGSDGTARATLSTRNNKENRTITVSATSGPLSQNLEIDVVGTEVNINGPGSVILNDSAPITVVLSDSDGNGIAGQAVNLMVDRGLLSYTRNGVRTDSVEGALTANTSENGQVTVDFTATISGETEITATALNATTEFNIAVQEDDFSFVNVPVVGLDLNQGYLLTLRWNKNGVAFANGTIDVSTSRGSLVDSSTVTTNAQGEATITIRSEFAGPASISAIGTDSDNNQVTARTNIEFVATEVDNIIVDATPDLIGPEGQTATITAMIRDGKGNLVKGKEVTFRLTSDSSGGSISPNSAITDSNGIASTVYTSNGVSGDNGVTIEANSDGISETTTLTVGDRAFDISLGTGNTIQTPDDSTYLKEFAVFVTDSSGRPIADAELTASLTPTDAGSYRKGFWQWDETNNLYFAIETTPTEGCANEDLNRDGRLQGLIIDGDGNEDYREDRNRDGELTPGNVASISFKDNITRTDEFGLATLQIRYPKQFGYWNSVIIKVFGQSSGTESSQSQVYRLRVATSDLSPITNQPPNSPYGLGNSCDDTE